MRRRAEEGVKELDCCRKKEILVPAMHSPNGTVQEIDGSSHDMREEGSNFCEGSYNRTLPTDFRVSGSDPCESTHR